ncbi:MAG: HDOD domain-containing protein [Nitrospirales bacterium]|nr:HDOD domain-containing protein [Nitrospirales bacterium]
MQLSLPLAMPESETSLSIFDRVKTCKSLPVLTPLASKILKMCQDDEANASELAQVISQDPGMVAQILFMANSGYYGGSRHKVTSAVQAVTLLGFSTIANLALSLCFHRLIKDLRDTNRSGLDHVNYWRQSVFASVAGRVLGQHFRHQDPELVFLSALLQDIGILALHEVIPEEVGSLYGKAGESHAALPQLELEHLGVDHPQVGAWLAQHWDLPEEFQIAILYSHTPELFETPTEFQTLVDCVALAGTMADIWTSSNPEAALESVKTYSQVRRTISQNEWGPVLHHITGALPKVASFFHTRLGNWEDITQRYHLALKYLAPSYQPQHA